MRLLKFPVFSHRKGLWADRRGINAVEFALVGPCFLLFLFAILGIGLDGLYQVVLDDAVRNAARQLQIGVGFTNNSGFAADVCSEFGYLARNCTSNITFSVQASSVNAGFAGLTPASLSTAGAYSGNSGNTSAYFTNGTSYADDVNILVQVAYPLPFFLPYVSKLVTETGTSSIVATATVRAEPY